MQDLLKPLETAGQHGAEVRKVKGDLHGTVQVRLAEQKQALVRLEERAEQTRGIAPVRVGVEHVEGEEERPRRSERVRRGRKERRVENLKKNCEKKKLKTLLLLLRVTLPRFINLVTSCSASRTRVEVSEVEPRRAIIGTCRRAAPGFRGRSTGQADWQSFKSKM